MWSLPSTATPVFLLACLLNHQGIPCSRNVLLSSLQHRLSHRNHSSFVVRLSIPPCLTSRAQAWEIGVGTSI
ncbi:hypothetical protein B0T18DRAFT_415271 [Schizothecium vesticola]|uniref:Secreted protein n=1 Tax=Schizothecium vesticola TaxID=314040 RepID=A0AA40EQ55_9PEZI|nr:hypothetical protein B0T18DRAFT_415271 [Schizothecium vesticola]